MPDERRISLAHLARRSRDAITAVVDAGQRVSASLKRARRAKPHLFVVVGAAGWMIGRSCPLWPPSMFDLCETVCHALERVFPF